MWHWSLFVKKKKKKKGKKRYLGRTLNQNWLGF